MGQTGCDGVQGTAVTSGHFLDLAGASPVNLGNCSGSAETVKAALASAYTELVKDGRVVWNISGKTLELRGTSTVLTFTDHGPASALHPSAAASG